MTAYSDCHITYLGDIKYFFIIVNWKYNIEDCQYYESGDKSETNI